MDVTTLTARLKTRFRDPSEDVITSTEWLSYLNDAYRDVIAAHPDWPFLEQRNSAFTATAAARTTTLPTDCFRVRAVYNATDQLAMNQIDGLDMVFRLYPSQAEPGPPVHFRLRNNLIEWYPLPEVSTTIVLDYIATPVMLSAGADEPVFPEQYHHLLVEHALARAYEDDGNVQQAAVHNERFATGLSGMMADLLSARMPYYPTIVDTWWG